MLSAIVALQIAMAAPGVDPFAFFQPSITVNADERRQLDRGEPIARVLPGQDLEVAVFAAVAVNIDGDRLVAWIRRIEELKKSAYVLAIRRFSDPPRIEDLADLQLDEREVAELRACRPDRCSVNVSPAEAAELSRNESAIRVRETFRQVVVRRAQGYLAGDRGNFVADSPTADEMQTLVHHSRFLRDHLPQLAEGLGHAGHATIPGVESFLYWSKERLAGKPVVGITDVNIWRGHEAGVPDVLVAGKEFFATHYVRASLGVTALVTGGPGRSNYLVYVNRSRVDALGGMFGGIVRGFVERRLKTEAADVLQGLRRRLESGEPPRQPKMDRENHREPGGRLIGGTRAARTRTGPTVPRTTPRRAGSCARPLSTGTRTGCRRVEGIRLWRAGQGRIRIRWDTACFRARNRHTGPVRPRAHGRQGADPVVESYGVQSAPAPRPQP
jgi:hypothetical protein